MTSSLKWASEGVPSLSKSRWPNQPTGGAPPLSKFGRVGMYMGAPPPSPSLGFGDPEKSVQGWSPASPSVDAWACTGGKVSDLDLPRLA